MLQIIVTLIMLRAMGGGLLINKGFEFPNFIFLLTLLTLWSMVYCLAVSKCEKGVLYLLNYCLFFSVILCLKTKAILLFYVFFEFSVVPITLIVFLYGYQPEKLQACLSLLLYTVVSRLPLLIYLLYNESQTFIMSAILTVPVTLGFMVKTPIYLLHTWLPKAHVEAPVGGSIALAGVLLKLGSYGLLVFLRIVKLNNSITFYFRISLVGSIISCFMCMRQGDLKLLIAYSSVVHIRVVTLGFLSGRELGYTCGLLIILRHGLCSPILFAFAFWQYESTYSRLLINNARSFHAISLIFIALVTLRIGVPPRMGLWAEVTISIRVIHFIASSMPYLLALFFFAMVYNAYIYTCCSHGKFNTVIRKLDNAMILPILQTVIISYASFFCLDLFHVSFVITY